ncbi:MAG: hypothetical protein QW358_00140, partial [Candidatus Hadarchaeum sp.]
MFEIIGAVFAAAAPFQVTINDVGVTFDRRLSGDRVGQHKAPPASPVNIQITASVSSTVENAVLIDYFPNEWAVLDANGGSVSAYDNQYNKIEWSVGTVDNSVSRSYVLRSPQLTTPPTNYYFRSELTYVGGSAVSENWRVIVADPTISYVGAGAVAYSAQNGASVAPAYPSGIQAGDLLVVFVGMKPSTANSGSVTTPSGWTLILNSGWMGGYGTTLGADTGNTCLWAFYKIATGSESGTLTISLSTNNVSWAQMYLFRNTTKLWDVAGTWGSDNTSGTAVSVAFVSDPDVKGGDYILGAFCIPTDVTTPNQFSGHSLSQSGVTFGTT